MLVNLNNNKNLFKCNSISLAWLYFVWNFNRTVFNVLIDKEKSWTSKFSAFLSNVCESILSNVFEVILSSSH